LVVHALSDARWLPSLAVRHLLVPALVAVLCALAFTALILLQPQVPGDPGAAAALEDILLWHSLLPRAAVALLAGAALGLSGVLMQRVLRNPLADASTLGIAAGAQLALTVAITTAPVLLMFSREAVAFAGGCAAAILVLGLGWRRGLDPVTVVLSGMVVTLIATALSASIILARGEYAMSIFIWGAGALNQQSWDAVISIAPRLAIGLAAAWLMQRPLTLLALDDSSAKSLGLALHSTRLALLALAIWLSATITAEVGIIGFLGLAAPAIARLAGARTMPQLMLAAPLAGAALLLLTDCAMQLLATGFSDLAPTGAAVALLGGPVLLFMLPKVHSAISQRVGLAAPLKQLTTQTRWLVAMAVGLALLLAVTLCVGRVPEGWHIATGALLSDLLDLRLPRTAASASAGAMLAAAGFIMQRMTGNPIASPDVLGVSAGGGVGLTTVLFLAPFAGPLAMLSGMAGGALIAFLIMLLIAARGRFGGDRLLLAGVAIGSFCMALLSIVLAGGSMQAFVLLSWLTGSTNGTGPFEAWLAVISAIVLIAPLPLMARWFAILPLGGATAASIGLPVATSRLVLAVFAALLTAIASFTVGPLSLTGLIAPHMARLIGFRHANAQLTAAVLIGAGLLVLADWLSRVVIYPYQVPVGLFAAMIGGPYLVWLLNAKRGSHG
jgi:ABC-type Fe3+-siderophore transport system permease subunit